MFGFAAKKALITRIEACAKPVLLFGAYGNGNLGDAYQAQSLTRLLKAIDPDLDIFATSLSECVIPPHPDMTMLPSATILNRSILRRFRALIIGGGGLLASNHKPLADKRWLQHLEVPTFLVGLGATKDVAASHRSLLERSSFVSARDDYSLESLQKHRADARFLPDPILADSAIRPLATYPKAADQVTWILRKATDRKVPLYMAIRQVLQANDLVVGIFPKTDLASHTGTIFKDRVEVTPNLDALTDRISRAGIVISNRYHGCIVAAKLGLATMAFDHFSGSSKVFQLSKQLELPPPPLRMWKRDIRREDIFMYRDAYLGERRRILDRIDQMSKNFIDTLGPVIRELATRTGT